MKPDSIKIRNKTLETRDSITFSTAAPFFQCMAAIGCFTIRLDED